MYFLNPTIFLYKDTLYSLVRKETDVRNWSESILSYELNQLDSKHLTILKSFPCSFKIDKTIFKHISRKDIQYPYYGIEDIKYAFQKDDKIYGICNVLIKQTSPREFRVGIVQMNIEDKNLILIKLLEKLNMTNQEKNWTIYSYQNKNYIITNLLPILKVYELLDNYELKLVQEKKSVYNYRFLTSQLHPNYRKLTITPCQSLYPIEPHLFLIFLKKRLRTSQYQYYIGFFNPLHYNLYINPIPWETGNKYLNSFQKIKNEYYTCFGIEDKYYKIDKISIPVKREKDLKRII